jgi:hypothetical protein
VIEKKERNDCITSGNTGQKKVVNLDRLYEKNVIMLFSNT